MDPVDVIIIHHDQRFTVTEYGELVRTKLFKSILIAQKIWDGLPKSLQWRHPLGYPYLNMALNLDSFYTIYVLRFRT